ncbi:MAG: 3-oxoacyl-[acyl-carrier protein] reductase, partial [uncultured Solirubrobacterales bacterium]
ELSRDRGDGLHRPEPARGVARARGHRLRARPRGLAWAPGRGPRPARSRGSDRRGRGGPLQAGAGDRRSRRGDRSSLPPRGDLRHGGRRGELAPGQ